MKRRVNWLQGDIVLWSVYIILTIISLVAVYSSIGRTAVAELGSTPMHQWLKHTFFVACSYVAIIFISRLDYRIFSRISQGGYYVSIFLLALAAFMHGRWIQIGPIQFQPSEIAKVCLIIFVARLLNKNRDNLESLSTFIKLIAYIGLVAGLIVFENFSTAALVFLSCYLMMYFAGVNKKYWWRLFLGGIIVVGIALFVFSQNYDSGDTTDMIKRSGTWGHRVDSWLNPNPDILTQENMAKMAVARGGLFGAGIGKTIHGRLMTQAHNDFIFSIIIEEAGTLVAMLIFCLYSIFFYRCIIISKQCKGPFGTLCVSGMGTVIYIQALVNMSVGVGLLPVTGQTLPFISYGGTAYIFLSCGVGVIQAIARDNKKESKTEQKDQNIEPII